MREPNGRRDSEMRSHMFLGVCDFFGAIVCAVFHRFLSHASLFPHIIIALFTSEEPEMRICRANYLPS